MVREQQTPAPLPTVTWPADQAAPRGDEFASAAYLRLRDQMLQNGPQSLPATAAGEGNDAAVWHAEPLSSKESGDQLARIQQMFTRGG